jgi:hypothetical protein
MNQKILLFLCETSLPLKKMLRLLNSVFSENYDTLFYYLRSQQRSMEQNALLRLMLGLSRDSNARLLDRKGKSHSLTRSGEVFLKHSRAVLSELDLAVRNMDALQQRAG